MKKYSEFEAEHARAAGPRPLYPTRDQFTIWYGYKAGNCIGSGTYDEVKALNPVSTEQVLDKPAYERAKADYYAWAATVIGAFNTALREEYKHLNDATYNALYSYAYDRGHSSGVDEVANSMVELDELATKIIQANK